MERLLSDLNHKLNRNNRTTCPVHGGTKANFSAKGFYGTCFSQCAGKSWSTVDLLMEIKNLTYPEALEQIAEKSGVEIKYANNTDRTKLLEEAKKDREHEKELIEATASALSLFEGDRVYEEDQRQEFDGRDWSTKTVQAFRMCQTPNKNLLSKASESQKVLFQELGLLKYSEGKSIWYDFFRDRVLFPIHNHKGQAVGFTGRRLKNAKPESPKYKNSSESSIFRKRKLLYGLFQNGRNIRQQGAYLFEGMADVVTAYDYGIRNTVAAGGTAVTEEQLKLLKGFTDTLTIIMDGDAAGLEATKKAVELAITMGFHCKVVLFEAPKEEFIKEGIDQYDPDSFLRKNGKVAFEAFIAEHAKDALIWCVMETWQADDFQAQEKAVELASKLIGSIKSDLQQAFYVRELCLKKHLGTAVKKHLQKVLATQERDKHVRTKKDKKPILTPDQENDVSRYGIYESGNRYWVSSDPSIAGYPVTNFAIRPIMLIVGSAKSERRVEITNIYGVNFTINIDSDRFVEIASFRKEVERHGNYILLEYFKPEYFIKIKRKLYDSMPVCYPINTLGHHKMMGFFSWSNGIMVDGLFNAADKHGIVAFNDKHFYLPAFASVSEDILSDDQDNSYEDQKNFIYVTEGTPLSIGEWSRKMKDVHGDKGMMAVAWYLAAIFRDIIYDKLEFFPHLNCFGPPGTGKSFLAWSLSYMFGKARRPFNLHDGTAVGFYRRMAQVRNGVAWYDEYNNGIDHRRAQGLKNAYDGAGREKGVASSDNRTMTTKVNSALLITGQEMPTQDIALYTRCITMSFSETSRTSAQQQKAKELVTIQQTGILSRITGDLQQYRDYVADKFDQMFDENRNLLTELIDDKEVSDRIISNYAVPLTAFWLIGEKMDLGFKSSDLVDFAYKNLIWQNESISEEDDLAQWWDTFDYYISKKQLQHKEDFLVQEIREVTIRKPGGKYTETEAVKFDKEAKLLFLVLNKAFRFYKEQSRKEGTASLSKEAIRYYLKHSPAFVGEVRAKKIGGIAKPCLVFDLRKLKLELPLSSEICDIEDS